MGTLPLPNHPLRSRGAAVERLSLRGGAISFKHRRTSHDAKHAPAARVQRFVGPRGLFAFDFHPRIIKL